MDALCLLRKRLHPLRLIKKRIFHNKASDSGRSENNAALLIEKQTHRQIKAEKCLQTDL